MFLFMRSIPVRKISEALNKKKPSFMMIEWSPEKMTQYI